MMVPTVLEKKCESNCPSLNFRNVRCDFSALEKAHGLKFCVRARIPTAKSSDLVGDQVKYQSNQLDELVRLHPLMVLVRILNGRIKWSKLKIPGKCSFDRVQIRIQNFCYIQAIVFDFGYLPLAAVKT